MLSQEIAGILTHALQIKIRNKKYLSRGKQILRGFLYHSAALFFGRYLLKYLRVLRLGNAQIEIPAELLAYTVITESTFPFFSTKSFKILYSMGVSLTSLSSTNTFLLTSSITRPSTR